MKPERDEAREELDAAVKGIADACRTVGIPVLSNDSPAIRVTKPPGCPSCRSAVDTVGLWPDVALQHAVPLRIHRLSQVSNEPCLGDGERGQLQIIAADAATVLAELGDTLMFNGKQAPLALDALITGLAAGALLDPGGANYPLSRPRLHWCAKKHKGCPNA